jgi:hypothetical protein
MELSNQINQDGKYYDAMPVSGIFLDVFGV